MKQPIKKTGKDVPSPTTKKAVVKKKTVKTAKTSHSGGRRHKKQYGISKLEQDFAHDFLDRLGLRYIYQYEAKDIGRFYDFAVTSYPEIDFITEEKDGLHSIKQDGQNVPIAFCIEVDGGYFHSDPRIVGENKLNRMQKHNKFVDMLKDSWCEKHGIRLLRVWEYDIRKNPKQVFDALSEFLLYSEKKKLIIENRKRPH